ncbi:MAG: toxin TcdB middle/N-terminal domain-containing protein [Polyangiaceae bacterium]
MDIDGTGTADLVYFDDRAYVFWNQAGNSFAPEPAVIDAVTGEAAKTVAVVDAFGRGTAQFVWARAPWQSGGPSLMAVDVVGETKPYLLTSVSNGLGLETKVQYAPSTKFYLADKAAGTPWAHPLPFPVHVVERVEVYDAVRRHRFVQQYSYHHGGYDPDEREFRGFGRVDTLDTEWTDATVGKGLFANLPPAVNNERPAAGADEDLVSSGDRAPCAQVRGGVREGAVATGGGGGTFAAPGTGGAGGAVSEREPERCAVARSHACDAWPNIACRGVWS